jgi:hypothetical protein
MTSAQHIPPRKANRSFPILFASCAIFWNATILLSPSIAKEILKIQRSNVPSVASCGVEPIHQIGKRRQNPTKHCYEESQVARPRQHKGDWEQGNESRCRAQTKRKCQ